MRRFHRHPISLAILERVERIVKFGDRRNLAIELDDISLFGRFSLLGLLGHETTLNSGEALPML